jgi:hypothetical protein
VFASPAHCMINRFLAILVLLTPPSSLCAFHYPSVVLYLLCPLPSTHHGQLHSYDPYLLPPRHNNLRPSLHFTHLQSHNIIQHHPVRAPNSRIHPPDQHERGIPLPNRQSACIWQSISLYRRRGWGKPVRCNRCHILRPSADEGPCEVGCQ